MTPPRLCVALPVRNGADFLGAALDSILAQDFTDFLLVVSDNASTDATPDILADAARRDPRVRVSRSPEPLDQVPNCNRAVALSPSPWIKLFCHDDLMRRDCLARIDAQLDTADEHGVGLIGNAERYLYTDGSMSPAEPDQPPVTLDGPDFIRMAMSGNAANLALPALTTATVRRTAFDQAGGFDRRFTIFDILLWFHLLRRWNYVLVRAQVTTNRIHPGQVAVAARRSLRMVEDYRVFMPEFLGQAGDELGLSRALRLRMRFKPVGAAATAIKDEMFARDWSGARRMFGQLPVAWWPVLVPLALRALHRDYRPRPKSS